MIAAKAAGKPYPDLVREMILEPQGLHSTFYIAGHLPAGGDRPAGAWLLREYRLRGIPAAGLQGDLERAADRPDVRRTSTSWARPPAAPSPTRAT